MHQLLTYFSAQPPFSTDDLGHIDAAFKPKTYRKGDYLLQQGQTNRHLWFIERGVLRLFETVSDGTEQTFYFVSAGGLMVDLESFHQQVPSAVNLQALTDCQTRAVSHDGFGRLLHDLPAWGPVTQRIAERALLEKVQKQTRLLHEDAKARYVRLVTEQPDVVRQVALGIIASYLGITLPSLSRLRKQLAVKHA